MTNEIVADERGHWYQRRWLRLLISLLLLAVALSGVGVEPASWVDAADRMDWWPIVVAFLLRPVAVWTNAWHASLLLDNVKAGLSVREVWRAYMFGEMLSRFIPGNLGTLAYVAKLSNRVGDAVIAQLLDRVFFLAFTLLFAAPSLALAGHVVLALLAAGALAGVVMLAYLLLKGVVRWHRLEPAHRNTIAAMLQSRGGWAAKYTFATVLSLALMTLLFWLLVVACGGSVDAYESVAAVTLVTIGAAMPFTINGIGIREWVFVALLGDNLPSEGAVVALAATTYLIGFASALLGVALWALTGHKSMAGHAKS